MSGELWRDKPAIRCFCESPLIRGNTRNTEQWASTGRCMDGQSRQNYSLIRPQNPTKFENDRIFRNGHRIKITQPNLMILVSFSSAEDALSKDVKIFNTFYSQCTKNPPFRFLWDTRYIVFCTTSEWVILCNI